MRLIINIESQVEVTQKAGKLLMMIRNNGGSCWPVQSGNSSGIVWQTRQSTASGNVTPQRLQLLPTKVSSIYQLHWTTLQQNCQSPTLPNISKFHPNIDADIRE